MLWGKCSSQLLQRYSQSQVELPFPVKYDRRQKKILVTKEEKAPFNLA